MKIKVVIIVILALLLGGLNNYRELNELAIVSAIAIDVIDDEFVVTAQIMNSKKESTGKASSGDSSNITVYTSKEKTINKALTSMMKESPRKIYISHMKLLVINEDVAKEGIGQCLDFFLRDHESDKEAFVIIAKDNKASNILKVLTPIETNPSKNIEESLKALHSFNGSTYPITMSEAVSGLLEPGFEITLPSVIIEGDEQKGEDEKNLEKSETAAKIKVSESAYFQKDKMKGYLKNTDNVISNLFKGNAQNTVIEIVVDNVVIGVEVFDFRLSMVPKCEEGNYVVEVKGRGDCNITEIEKGYEKTDDEYEKYINEHIKSIVEKYIYNVENVYKSDIIGIGAIYNRFLHKEYNEDLDFTKTKFNINIEINVKTKGGSIKKW